MTGYFTAVGICLRNELSSIKKKKDVPLHPIFEAITNSFEAITERFGIGRLSEGEVEVVFNVQKELELEPPTYTLTSISVRDNGIGLDDVSFERLKSLRDTSKKYNNKGTGRIQFIHAFNETIIDSQNLGSGGDAFYHRKVVLSKSELFLQHNAILRIDVNEKGNQSNGIETEVSFFGALDERDASYFSRLGVYEAKREIIRHFLGYFCNHREKLPRITVKRIVDNDKEDRLSISKEDVPQPFKEDSVTVNFSKIGHDSRVVDVDETVQFDLKGFKLNADELPKNELVVVSKGESGSSLPLQDIAPMDKVENNRYLFLLSGQYFDTHDSDTRGNIELMTEQELKKKEPAFDDGPVVLRESVISAVNKKIRESFPEIARKKEERDNEVDRLANMFLLNKATVNSLKGNFRNTDTAEQILRKIYEADSRIAAKKDAEIKQIIDGLDNLNPVDSLYQSQIEEQSKRLASIIPLRNRSALSQYVARRKLVLELFNKILQKELATFKGSGRIDEDVLHNLLFRQHSKEPVLSDLWLINEECIYFKGVSEARLLDVEYGGKRIFSKQLSPKDEAYLRSLEENRLAKRPDILLFPEEGKCVIIELKAPDINVSDHLTQIDFYANLILNYTAEELHLRRFYGYLIGEGIEHRDVRGHDSSYVQAAGFDYWYRPEKLVAGFDGVADGTLHSEVLRYSSLLKRAFQRNRIFIDKLIQGSSGE